MTKQTRILCVVVTFGVTFQCLAQTPEPFEVRRAEAVFEELPELKASEILKPELLKGPRYVVRHPVPTASGMNQFTIDSDFGVFEADGNEMLLQRLTEIDAIARLHVRFRVSVAFTPYRAFMRDCRCADAWPERDRFPESSD